MFSFKNLAASCLITAGLLSGCADTTPTSASVCNLLTQEQINSTIGETKPGKPSSLGNVCFYDGQIDVRIYQAEKDRKISRPDDAVKIADLGEEAFVWQTDLVVGGELQNSASRYSIVLNGPGATQQKMENLLRLLNAQA